MTIEQFLKLSLETEMPEFERLKINIIDLAETANLYELKKKLKLLIILKKLCHILTRFLTSWVTTMEVMPYFDMII